MSENDFGPLVRTPRLINRTGPLEEMRQLIQKNEPGAACQVVFIQAEGGLGKSRLLEEVLWRGGNPEERRVRGVPEQALDWCEETSPFRISKVIDVVDIALHTPLAFIKAVRDAFNGYTDVPFTKFDNAQARLGFEMQFGSYSAVDSAMGSIEKAFWEDYQNLAKKFRMVIVVDTVERLSPIEPTWFEKLDVVADNLKIYTAYWLAQSLDKLQNTTLLLSGRAKEGERFFDLIRHKKDSLIVVKVDRFEDEETKQYIKALAEVYKDEPQLSNVYENLCSLSENDDHLRALHRYADGRPIYLALYVDLLIEGETIPEILKDCWEDAEHKTEDGLPEIKDILGDEFIKLLLKSETLTGQILQVLVRTPLGLSLEQLQDVLDYKELKDEDFRPLRRLSIFKPRPGNRLALQDELYKIYKEYCVRNGKIEEERKERIKLYQKLYQFAVNQFQERVKKAQKFVEEDAQLLQTVILNPGQASTFRLPGLSGWKMQERITNRAEMQVWEREQIYYALCLDLRANFNDTYFDMMKERWLANNPERVALARMVVHEVLLNPDISSFIDIQPWWNEQRDRDENALTALQRVAEQDEVVRWMIRLVLNGKYKSVIELDDAIEREVSELPEGYLQNSWRHTMFKSLRAVWREYSHILLHQDVMGAIKRLEALLINLHKLRTISKDEKAIWLDNSWSENGFVGHPAEQRLYRLISLIHNYTGYGYVIVGDTDKAIEHYDLALAYMHQVGDREDMATTLTNLSRALADAGRTSRARRICEEVVALRTKTGIPSLISVAQTTLAMLHNEENRPDLAWLEALMAVSHARRANDTRGLGLALIQLGQALRRLMSSGTYVLPSQLEEIYTAAETLLKEALEIFTEGPAANEPMRVVETYLELACLRRDNLLLPKPYPSTYQYSRADFEQALVLAKKLENEPLILDVQVNWAWLEFRNAQMRMASEPEMDSEKLYEPVRQRLKEIKMEYEPEQLPQLKDKPPRYFRQCSKICSLRTLMELTLACQKMQRVITQPKDPWMPLTMARRRQEAEEFLTKDLHGILDNAARYFVLALGYAQLFSPRSSSLSAVYDNSYRILIQLSPMVLKKFFDSVTRWTNHYKINEIRAQNLADAEKFLQETFPVLPDDGE